MLRGFPEILLLLKPYTIQLSENMLCVVRTLFNLLKHVSCCILLVIVTPWSLWNIFSFLVTAFPLPWLCLTLILPTSDSSSSSNRSVTTVYQSELHQRIGRIYAYWGIYCKKLAYVLVTASYVVVRFTEQALRKGRRRTLGHSLKRKSTGRISSFSGEPRLRS